MSEEFDLNLRPYRSLSSAGFWVVMGIVAVWSFAGGVVFLLAGAWPVLGFVALDLALVWWAFRASYGDRRACERLRLAGGAFTVERTDKSGGTERFDFAAYWLRVTLEHARGQPRVVLASHGKWLEIGAFLPPAERETLADLLRAALARARTETI